MRQDTPAAQHARPRQGAHRPADRVHGQGHRHTSTSSGPATSAPWQSSRRRARATGWRPRRADLDAGDQAPRAGHGLRDRAEDEGRRGQGFHAAAPAAGGGPDDRPAPRPADRRADRRRPDADPRRGRRRPAAVALRRRGHAEAAARPLPGDDPPAGQGARTPQEADRRPRAVRRLPHRDRAARRRARASSSSTRSRAA